MKRYLLVCLLSTLLAGPAGSAEPKKRPPAEPIPAPIEAKDTSSPIVFQGDEVSLALRTLAQRAELSLVIDGQITGTVTLRLEKKTPREAMEIIAQAHDLILEEKEGTLYVRPRHPKPVAAESAQLANSIEEVFGRAMAPALVRLCDVMLDYQARPEVARKIAKSKRLLYDALVAEGFSKEEALRLVMADSGITIPSFK